MTGEDRVRLERSSTGVAGLDAILGGGIPDKSITMVAGEPGSGKTVLTLQILFHAARNGLRAIYFTTLSEPSVKVIRYMQLFEFFDEELLKERITLADLGSLLRNEGAEVALAELVAKVEAEQPDVVVVDSFKAIHDMVEPGRERSYVYDLAVAMAGWGATTFLVGEYTQQDMQELPEFAVADAIIWLGSSREQLALSRLLEVRKLRGSEFTTGVHYLDITKAGVEFYPRVRGPAFEEAAPPLTERVATGVAGVDELLDGGVPRSSSTLVVGGTGTGKTVFGLTFLVEGARRGEPGVLLALEEMPDQIRSTAAGFGWDLAALEAEGLLRIFYTSPVELSTDRFLHESLEAIHSVGARRLMLDSLTSLSLGAISERRFKELVYALTKHLRAESVTAFLAMEVVELLGMGRISGAGVSFAADNIVFMRYVESGGWLERALAVIKARGIGYNPELRRFTISARGIEVGDRLSGQQGVLTSFPTRPGDQVG